MERRLLTILMTIYLVSAIDSSIINNWKNSTDNEINELNDKIQGYITQAINMSDRLGEYITYLSMSFATITVFLPFLGVRNIF